MKNRKKAPVIAHFLAAATGMGFDPELAKDYWLGTEEPWSAEQEISNRFLKLAYMYVASAVVQIGIPAVLLISILGRLGKRANESHEQALLVWGIAAVIVLCGIASGILIAFFVWRKITNQRKLDTGD